MSLDRITRKQTEQDREIRRLRKQQGRGIVSVARLQGPIPASQTPQNGAVSNWVNDSGATRAAGTVVIASGDRLFDVTATEAHLAVIGAVESDSIDDGAEGRIRHVGYQPTLLVQDGVASGDFLAQSPTLGRAFSIGNGFSNYWGTFARALTAFAGPGPGTVAAYLFPPTLNPPFAALEFPMGGDEITAGIALDFRVPYNLEILAWSLLADQTGDILLDLWKDTFANYPPTIADTVVGTEPPEIIAGIKAELSPVTDWEAIWLKGECVRVNVDSVTDIARVTLCLDVIML